MGGCGLEVGGGSPNGLVGRPEGGGEHEVRLPSIFEQGFSSPGCHLREEDPAYYGTHSGR